MERKASFHRIGGIFENELVLFLVDSFGFFIFVSYKICENNVVEQIRIKRLVQLAEKVLLAVFFIERTALLEPACDDERIYKIALPLCDILRIFERLNILFQCFDINIGEAVIRQNRGGIFKGRAFFEKSHCVPAFFKG